MRAYYNEIEPAAAAWIRELIKEGVITDGEVDERSIEDVLPADVAGFDRVHWFAGLWLMGLPDVWHSCGVRAMQSRRKSPKHSSKVISK
jgi:hypothetical protein